MSNAKIGPFEVGDKIGEGGMGAVYLARHVRTDVEVALKVLPGRGSEEAKRQFHREVQAQAELVHPGVVHLFEYGEIDEGAQRASEGELRAGTPYVAMEYAEAGTVRDRMPVADWEAVRSVLLQVLDTLAFAHARDIVHRDLKPENFLVFAVDRGGDATGRRIKLADFGLAHSFEGEKDRNTENLRAAAGTPHYMPPEQARGEWRNYGPWTDIYALGCIAWELVCGRAPYRGSNPIELVVKHEQEEPPELDPRFPVPDGIEAWIRRAMASEFSARFHRAAEAARALPEFEESDLEHRNDEQESSAREADSTTGELAPTLRSTLEESPPATVSLESQASLEGSGAEATDAGGGEPADRQELARPLEVPEHWRREWGWQVPGQLVGTGLGLFGLREVPFVDRDDERDVVWEALHDVVGEGEFRAVWFVGESGTGKSRLAKWGTTRMHEVGVSEKLRMLHTAGGAGWSDGVRGMVHRRFHTWKLERGETYEHLLDHLPPLEEGSVSVERDAAALTELLHPTERDRDSGAGPNFDFSSTRHRTAVLTRLIERLEGPRTPVLWIDDLQWGRRAIELMDHWMAPDVEMPSMLVLVTLRPEELVDRPGRESQIRELMERPESRRVDVDEMALRDQQELIERTLPLDEELRDRLARRTEGNPMFAIQMLGHWVDSGIVRVGEEGFERRCGRDAGIPEDIQTLWLERLDRLVDDLGMGGAGAVWRALELGALLGREVDADEWRAVCRRVGVDPPGGLIDRLVERGLARRRDGGWAFAHGLLVDSLRERLRERGDWQTLHRACAQAIEETGEAAETASRRADHWLEAGEPERALEPLGRHSEYLAATGRLSEAREVLDRRREILEERLGVGGEDRRWIYNELRRLRRANQGGTEIDEVIERARELEELAERAGFERLYCRAKIRVGRFLRAQNAHARARTRLEEGLEMARAHDWNQESGEAATTLAWLELRAGESRNALELFRASQEYLQGASAPTYESARSQYGEITALLELGRLDASRRRAEEALESFREKGLRLFEVNCLLELGEVARMQGDYSESRFYYARFIQSAEELGIPYFDALGRLNRAFTLLAEGEVSEAELEIERAELRFGEMRVEQYGDVIELARLAAAAANRDWDAFESSRDAYAEVREAHGKLSRDHPWIIEVAADFADAAESVDRARELREAALEMWRELGDDEEVERLERELDGGS